MVPTTHLRMVFCQWGCEDCNLVDVRWRYRVFHESNDVGISVPHLKPWLLVGDGWVHLVHAPKISKNAGINIIIKPYQTYYSDGERLVDLKSTKIF